MAGASMKDIKRRIKSVESTMQITKAMELVASSKLRRAKEQVERSRPYFDLLYGTLVDIARHNRDFSSPYTKKSGHKRACYLVIAGDRGLAGGYNANILKAASQAMEGKQAVVLPMGLKAQEYFQHRSVELLDCGDYRVEEIGVPESLEIAQYLCRAFLKKQVDEVYLVYTRFLSMLSQEPVVLPLLPLQNLKGKATMDKPMIAASTEFDPDPEEVFGQIVPYYVAGMIFGAITESNASEQGARRTAMESATDNAKEMIEDLSLKYNRARQGAITQELTEIVAGAQAQQ